MDLNATLFGQMITFAGFVWFTMKFIWPILEKTLKDRQLKIAEGLAAADRGHTEQVVAQKYALQHIHESKKQALDIIEQATKQAVLILEEAHKAALTERAHTREATQVALMQERLMIQQDLKNKFITLLGESTQKLLLRTLTAHDQDRLLEMCLEPTDSNSMGFRDL